MPQKSNSAQKVACIIMGGGRGTRLYPLTRYRCKPAVPLGGKYRLIDIPLSNCINSGYNNIYILSQFNTASLHRHIQETFKFDTFSKGFVDILSAEQTQFSESWYQGTADAVRQNMRHFNAGDDDLFLILSGDQLYNMDFQDIINHHIETNADVTISAKAVPKRDAKSFGVMKVADDYTVKAFIEKPQDPQLINDLTLSSALKGHIHNKNKSYCLASMGIYVFKGKVLREALENSGSDFGKEIIPSLLGETKICCYIFDDYWEDIGTIRSFFEANLMLAEANPPFSFQTENGSIYTRARHLPPAKISKSTIDQSLITDGSIVTGATITRSVIGIRSAINEGSVLENVVMMGADRYEKKKNIHSMVPRLGIGTNCFIKDTIIDKNARIGNDVHLSPEGLPEDHDAMDGVYIRDGVILITKDAVIPDGTVLSKPLSVLDRELAYY